MEPKEWASLKGVSLATMAGEKVVDLPTKPTYLGKGFDQLPPLRRGIRPVVNTSEDFAIWVLPEAAKVTVLELAADDPKAGDWVWIVGQQGDQPLKFYRARLTQVVSGTMLMNQFDRFDPTGFSGGPVVNAEGQVVGTMLAAENPGNSRQGATVGHIRERLKGQ